MGSSSWRSSDFDSYSKSKGYTTTCSTTSGYSKLSTDGLYSATQMYTATLINPMLTPKNVMRECRDSEEHPNTVPIILALDVTGSMSDSLIEVASALNEIISKLYETITDVEICVMGIGDLSYDRGPIQIGQFESDIRIAEQLDKIWFERGGGSNPFESYTAAWYMGSRHTDLDCWKRGKKGIIITLGDEEINPYLPHEALNTATGDDLQASVETSDLYNEASQKYDLYHIFVDHNNRTHRIADHATKTFKDVIGEDHVVISTVNELSSNIIDIVKRENDSDTNRNTYTNANNEITW